MSCWKRQEVSLMIWHYSIRFVILYLVESLMIFDLTVLSATTADFKYHGVMIFFEQRISVPDCLSLIKN